MQQQTVNLGGSSNTSNVAGRDQNLHYGDVNVLPDTEYFEPSLDSYGDKNWPSPPKAGEMVELLVRHRLLILGGPLEDKTDAARHIAFRLRKSLPQEGGGVQVRERYDGQDPIRIEGSFGKEAGTIVLLPEVAPHHLSRYTFDSLWSTLRSGGSYAILTTNCSRSQWGVTVEDR